MWPPKENTKRFAEFCGNRGDSAGLLRESGKGIREEELGSSWRPRLSRAEKGRKEGIIGRTLGMSQSPDLFRVSGEAEGLTARQGGW